MREGICSGKIGPAFNGGVISSELNTVAVTASHMWNSGTSTTLIRGDRQWTLYKLFADLIATDFRTLKGGGL